MTQRTTTKILPALAAVAMVSCRVLPPREAFLPQIAVHHADNPHALFVKGKNHLAQGEARKAAAQFRAALRLQPNFDEAQLGLAHAYREAGAYRRARRLYRQILERSPRNVQVIEGLASAEAHLGRRDEAQSLLQRALAIDPESVSTLNALADLHYGRWQYAEALRYWERSLRLKHDQDTLATLVEDLRDYVRKYGGSSDK